MLLTSCYKKFKSKMSSLTGRMGTRGTQGLHLHRHQAHHRCTEVALDTDPGAITAHKRATVGVVENQE